MTAKEVTERISANDNLISAKLKYCLVTSDKLPTRYDGILARPNTVDDFVSFDRIKTAKLEKYAGLGISIQGSEISAIDVDHCFDEAFNIESADERAKTIISLFQEIAYIEFSFSGCGLRVLFRCDPIQNYSDTYYIKNSKTGCEFYNCYSNSYRYVTITGNAIVNNPIGFCNIDILNIFLDTYMKKPERIIQQSVAPVVETRSQEELMRLVKYHYRINPKFQDNWFDTKHRLVNGGSFESETDFYLLQYLYLNITADKNMLKNIFEESPFFKSKDWKHVSKWNRGNNRYYEYLYTVLTKG